MKTANRQLWILAGGNGAGKSTFYKTRLKSKGIHFVNADEIQKQQFDFAHSESEAFAQKAARKQCYQNLAKGISFCFETVFSHPSKLDLLREAKANSFEVILVYIGLESVELNVARVLQRVSEGGHSVPEEKIRARLPRVLNYMKEAIKIANKAILLDNSRPDNPFTIICKITVGKVKFLTKRPPDWALNIVS